MIGWVGERFAMIQDLISLKTFVTVEWVWVKSVTERTVSSWIFFLLEYEVDLDRKEHLFILLVI